MIDVLSSSPLVHAIGATLVAFLWQGSLLGVVAFVVLSSSKRATAQARYVTACLALVVMAATPVVTFVRQMNALAPTATAHQVAAAIEPRHDATDGAFSATNAEVPSDRTGVALPFVVLGWSVGVSLLTLHVLYGWLQIGRLRRRARPIADDVWTSRLARIASRLSVGRRVRLLESAHVDVPAVIGWLRPAILMPASVLSGLAPWQLDAILAHELAHIRRADFVVNLAQRALEIALFYHPAVWWISSEIRREREHCCDDLAAACCESRREYAAALGALAALRARTPALAIGAHGGDLLGRIRRLVDARAVPSRSWTGGHVMIVVPAAMCLLLSVSASATQSVVLPELPVTAALVLTPAPALTSPAPAEPPKVLAAVVPSVAQVPGRLSGAVRDDAGGVMPGVTISVRAAQGSIERSAVTNARGEYAIDNLPPGAYTVRAGSLPGFQTVSVDVTIASGAITVPFRLPVGTLTEHVHVSAVRGAPSTVALGVAPPQTCSTSSECRSAAAAAYQRGDFASTDALISQALRLLRSEQPGLFQMPVPQSGTSSTPGVVRVGGDIRPPQKILNVAPIYPPDAVAADIAGTVTIEAVVGKDGSILDARIVSGRTELDVSALDAVRLWNFTPTLLDGVPVTVNATVTIDFEIR